MSSFYLQTGAEERLKKGSLEGIVKISGQGQHGNQGPHFGNPHPRLSTDVKAAIGTLGKLLGNKNASKIANIHASTVGNYARGKEGSGKNVDPEVKRKVEERLEGIQGRATSALDLAIQGLLDPTRYATGETKLRDLGAVAANLSSVIERLRGKNNTMVVGQVILMSPPSAKLEGYEVIEAETRVLE